VAPPLPPRRTLTGAPTRSSHSRENDFHPATILESQCGICGGKGHIAKRCVFRAQVDELVQRHKRDVKKSTGGRQPKKNKARHGFDFSRDTRGDPGRPPRSSSPHRKKLRWGDSREINFLEGAEINCLTFDEREPSSYVAMVDAPEDPEEPNAVPLPPTRRI
jgi:hypothetical protein